MKNVYVRFVLATVMVMGSAALTHADTVNFPVGNGFVTYGGLAPHQKFGPGYEPYMNSLPPGSPFLSDFSFFPTNDNGSSAAGATFFANTFGPDGGLYDLLDGDGPSTENFSGFFSSNFEGGWHGPIYLPKTSNGGDENGSGGGTTTVDTVPIPEPPTIFLLMLGMGLLVAAWLVRLGQRTITRQRRRLTVRALEV